MLRFFRSTSRSIDIRRREQGKEEMREWMVEKNIRVEDNGGYGFRILKCILFLKFT